MQRRARETAARVAFRTVSLAALVLASACSGGGSSGGGGRQPASSELRTAPSGQLYFRDANERGTTGALVLEELLWGRLVDVYDVDESGEPRPEPLLEDFVVNEMVQSDGLNYVLETNPVSQRGRLVVLRTFGQPEPGRRSFAELLHEASRDLPAVLARNDDGTSPAPFSQVARNACLVLRFNDCLQDTAQAEQALDRSVRLRTGYRPSVPFQARLRFDRHHGAVVGGAFHSTRVLVDLTLSELEVRQANATLAVNLTGLPASERLRGDPNVSLRLPTRSDPLGVPTVLLRSLRGRALSATRGGPVDPTSPTLDVVRAFRSGNSEDRDNGFLHDRLPPRILGEWPLVVLAAQPSGGAASFSLDLRFSSPCQQALASGDVLTLGGSFLEVTAPTGPPSNDTLEGVPVRAVGRGGPGAGVPLASALLGRGSLLTAYDPASQAEPGCWLTFSPPPGTFPTEEVDPNATVSVRFSEAMVPETLEPMDGITVLRGDAAAGIDVAEYVVVGDVIPSPDLRRFTFVPAVPLNHRQGQSETLHLRLGAVTDLSGAEPQHQLPPVDFHLAGAAPTERTGSLALRFSELDELWPRDTQLGSLDDVRGQVTYDFQRGRIRPRAIRHASYPVDLVHPVTAPMNLFNTLPVATPLSPYGSRAQLLWRYADVGWGVTDETKYDLDVTGLSWAPFGGLVVREYYEELEIRLAHARWLPDEALNGFLLPKYPSSGLVSDRFENNVLQDPRSPQTTVHEGRRGYEIDPADVFFSGANRPLLSFPMETSTGASFTWRDTSVAARGGHFGAGVPMEIEAQVGAISPQDVGSLYAPNAIRTVGLPLLLEIHCYPQASAGRNGFQVALAVNNSAAPNFRTWSTGGTDTEGRDQLVIPDLEPSPRGGYNPSTRPPGQPTARSADNSLYLGQLDTVTRISRGHTVWIDAGFDVDAFLEPVIVPDAQEQPPGTRVLVEYRGATGFDPGVGTWVFDAPHIDAYGVAVDRSVEPPPALDIDYLDGNAAWFERLADLDGARYVQMRFTFIGDVPSGRTAELSAVGLAYRGGN